MAERRMFAKTIIDSDAFIEMPMSARLLYYDLGMRADDDGFVNSPKKIMKMIGASADDLNVLILRKFIIPFESGVVVIKHWKIHNYIQNDRYKETNYKEEKSMLETDENKAYRLMDTPCIHDGYNTDTQSRLGKDSIGKDSIGNIDGKIEEKNNKLINILNDENFFEKISLLQLTTQSYDKYFKDKNVFINLEMIDLDMLDRRVIYKIALTQELIKYCIETGQGKLYLALNESLIDKIFSRMLEQEAIDNPVKYFISAIENEVIRKNG